MGASGHQPWCAPASDRSRSRHYPGPTGHRMNANGDWRERLAARPRVRLGQWPTPLEPLPRLSAALGGPRLWVKRDDAVGPALGGNKTRKLELLFGEARARDAQVVATFGGLQSNFARQMA